MLKKFNFIVLFTVLFTVSYAQDIHFSQFYASPLTLNPANTGNYVGDWRIMNNHRRQWKSITTPFVTTSIGYDQQINYLNEHFSGGIILINDKSGDAQLKVNKFLLSGAYHKKLGSNNVHVGFQAGIVNKAFDINKLTFPDQYDHSIGDFNNSMSTGATVAGDQLTYLDLNIGLAWSRKMGKFEPQIGFSLFHFNKPKESFFNQDSRLEPRNIVSIGGVYDLTEKLYLQPNFLLMTHTKASDMLMGANLGFKLGENQYKIKSVFGGLLVRDGLNKRNTDAMVMITGLNFKHLSLGLSYDFNISELKSISNNRGAIEFSIIYTGLSTLIDKITIPCDRY